MRLYHGRVSLRACAVDGEHLVVNLAGQAFVSNDASFLLLSFALAERMGWWNLRRRNHPRTRTMAQSQNLPCLAH